jgi:hypothetical protein
MPRASRSLLQVLVVAFLVTASSGVGATPPATSLPEYQVKAEFIERFTRFVDWPESAFPSRSSSFVVCVWGAGALSEQLERVIVRRAIKARAVRVVHVASSDQLGACHLLYVATTELRVVRAVSAMTRGKAILSVSDQPGFAEEGMLINLILNDDGFVRFEINREVARASGLKISAKLLRLARLVGER